MTRLIYELHMVKSNEVARSLIHFNKAFVVKHSVVTVCHWKAKKLRFLPAKSEESN